MKVRNADSKKTLDIITHRLEVLSSKRIEQKLAAREDVKGYWGTAPTGKPHIGYLVPFVKIAECIAAGIDIQILIADTYGFLVNYDATMEVVERRSQYYSLLIASILRSLGVPDLKIWIERESSFATTEAFRGNFLRLCAASTQDDIRSVGLEVATTSMLSPLLCPLYQALSEVHTGCDFQLGGIDQRGMFAYADKLLPRVGHRSVSHLLAPMIPGLKTEKMSSSAPEDTKIMFFDSAEAVRAKIAGADVSPKEPARNALLACLEHIVFPVYALGIMAPGTVPKVALVGGATKGYESYKDLEEDFLQGLADVDSLRPLVADTLNHILEPVRQEYAASEEWRAVDRFAYGTPEGY